MRPDEDAAGAVCVLTGGWSFDLDFLASQAYILLSIADSQFQRGPFILCPCPLAYTTSSA